MPGIGVISNPRSRQNLKHPDRIRRLAYILGQGGSSKATKSFEELDQVIDEFKRQEIDILALNGGDGTNHVVLTAMMKAYGDKPLPKIALLRGGTLNTISNACDIKGRPSGILFNITEKYSNGEAFEITERDLLKIGDMYGFIFGNGIVANFMETYYASGSPSPTQGALTLARGIGSMFIGGPTIRKWMEKVYAKVTVDGEVLPMREWVSIFGSTIREIGLNFRVFHRCEEEPHSFHMLTLVSHPVWLVADLPHIYFGRPLHPCVGYETVAKDVLIEAEHPFGYTIDGDMHKCESGTLRLTVGPRLQLIVK